MDPESHPFFRRDALKHYLQGREEQVLPRFASPQTFAWLWGLLLLLVVAAMLASFCRIPLYVSGVAIITREECTTGKGCKQPVLIALLPPDSLPGLRVGQTIFLEIKGSRDRLRISVIKVLPVVESPEVIRNQFAIDKSLALAIDQPAAVAIAEWKSGGEAYAGSVLRIQVEFGSRRILSFAGKPKGESEYGLGH